MRRVLFTALCVLSLFSLFLVNVGTVKAAEASGYTRLDWPTQVVPTIDGQWSPANEWTDTDWTTIGSDAAFGSTWDMPDNVYSRWFIEFFADDTDDPADYFEMCIDWDNSGGSAPGATHHRIYIEGHNNFTLYQGTGSGWTEVTPSANPADLTYAATLSTSPNGTLAHWIYEMNILKNAGTGLADITWGVRVALYDATTQTLLVWPPDADRDVPDEWGTNSYEPSAPWVPEGFGIGIIVLLSSVAVIVGFYYLRKRPKTEIYRSRRTGDIGCIF